jgi:hypothetical protein
MSSNARFRISLLAGACVLGAAALAVSTRHSAPEVQPGTTVLAVAEEGVRAVIYRAGAMTLTARRVGAGPFDVHVTYSDGRAAQQCQVSQDLAGLLHDLSEIDARRQLTEKQLAGEFPLEVGILEVEDNVGEPMSPFTVRMTKDRSAVALAYSGVAIEADVMPDVFVRLGKGCSELAGDSKVVKLWPQG